MVVLGDQLLDLLGLFLDLQTLQGGQSAQLQVEDRIGLGLIDLEQIHQTGPRFVRGRGAADQGDDLVEGVEGLEVAAQDVSAFLGLAQTELRATDDDFDLVLDPQTQERVDAQRARHTVDEGQHVRGEVLLQRGVLVQVVEHDFGHGIALEHDDQALTGAARGLVTQIGDAGDLAVLDVGGDLRGQGVRVDHVRQLGDDEAGAALDLFDFDDGSLGDRAATGAVGVLDALAAEDRRAHREVGPLDDAEEGFESLFLARLRVGQQPLCAGSDLTQVVRRNVRGHSHSDAGRAVDQQVREPGGQNHGFLVAAVVVVLEVDGAFFDVPDHLHGQGRHLALGITRGGRSVVARGTEVALTGHERVAHRPRLHEADHGVVDRRVAVRVVLAHHVADDARALGEVAVRAVAAVEHRVEHAAMDGLESVADVGQGAADDHAHRVIEVRPLHLEVEINLFDPVDFCSDIVLVGQCGLFPCVRTVSSWVSAVCGGDWCVQRMGAVHPVSHPHRGGCPVRTDDQISRKRTSFAFSWMKRRRESTSSPMRTVKISSATIASSSDTCLSSRWSGSIVVSHSSS